jgi:anti-sigma regulatory factor (Ser/Thr protein kinase)
VDEAAGWASSLVQQQVRGAMAQEQTASFSPHPESAGAARRWAREVLHGWGPEASSTDVLLVTSELVTNAVVYGTGEIYVRLAISDCRVSVAVTDRGPQAVVPWVPTIDEVHGRGLWIVDRLARRWGVDDHEGDGKTVWAEVAIVES